MRKRESRKTADMLRLAMRVVLLAAVGSRLKFQYVLAS